MKRILPMIVAALVGVGAYFIFVHEPSSSVSQSAELTAPAEAVATEVADNADGDA